MTLRVPERPSYTVIDGELARLFHRPRWMERAACRGLSTDLFFPERGADASAAKAVCAACPVRDDCYEYAFESGERHGIWGGTSERERRRIRRQRRIEATA
jgi:WhiB family redox-sensing transcriptional regulator